MQFLVDACVDAAVGEVLVARGFDVEMVNRQWSPGTPDPTLDAYAREHGLILVSNDQRFMKHIQQPRFQYADPASSGYGRIMFILRVARHAPRLNQCMDLIEHMQPRLVASNRRLLLTVADHYLRWDDEPMALTPRGTVPQPSIGVTDGGPG